MSATDAAAGRTLRREHRCSLRGAEQVCVREYNHMPAKPRRATSGYSEYWSMEILHSADNGRTWTELPMRISPWARIKCIFLEGEWPPDMAKALSCEDGRIALDFVGPDYWDNWPLKIWRATYRPRWRWWSLEVIGRQKLARAGK
jgi:hypothetical protein